MAAASILLAASACAQNVLLSGTLGSSKAILVIDGQMQTEEWNKTDSRGKFGTMVASRFMIEAEGDAGSIDELKAAVAAIDSGALKGLGN